ncbi:MAG: FAD/NAD(P)-binding protein [Bradymonadia bacterium]
MGHTWLIIGGGLHGVHMAVRLVAEGDIDAEQICILDPAETLLSRWRQCSATTGMTHLRSPAVHHLDLGPWSLQQFAGKRRSRKPGLFAAPYNRPALSLFNAHCERVIDTYALRQCHLQDLAVSCAVNDEGVVVTTASGRSLEAQNVVLALGASEHPMWPAWAPRDHPHVHHIFARDFNGWPTDGESPVAVVGGGISAGQVALRLLKAGHPVHLVSRHALRQHQFDSDPGWLGPKYMVQYNHEKDLDRRRAMIQRARHRGSVPPDVRRALQRAIQSGALTWHEAEIEGLEAAGDAVQLNLTTPERPQVSRVLLATGFDTARPGGALVDDLIDAAGLPTAACGYPIVNADLRWHPRVHVMGPLAELELGPTARNIAGARNAADRIINALGRKQPAPLERAS